MPRRLRAFLASAFLCLTAGCALLAATAPGEQSNSLIRSFQAGHLAAGGSHTCAILLSGQVRCWGEGSSGRLGYGNSSDIGDNETPASAGSVDLGPGRTATAMAAAVLHTCAILDTGQVRCWGFGANGRLGYGNTDSVGDNETPGAVGTVDLGAGRRAVAISAGTAHTCVILDTGQVRCWGVSDNGKLGNGSPEDVGDNETPGSVPPLDLGAGRTAVAISAGVSHTCAILDTGQVRCWGFGGDGALGYGNTNDVGDNEAPGSAGPVDLGPGRTATAITAGAGHTCVILDNGQIRCWGRGDEGQLGYGNTTSIGDSETPAAAGPVDVGAGRTAEAIGAGILHTCAILDTDQVRCWGFGGNGRLGYGNTADIGDNETPATVGPVSLGTGSRAMAVTGGFNHSCALLDTGQVRCWGENGAGELGIAGTTDIGDNETPIGPGSGPAELGAALASAVADLQATAASSSPAAPVGQSVLLTFDVNSQGPDLAAGVRLDLTLPAGLAPGAAAPSQGSFDGATRRWTVGLLGPGDTARLRLPVTVTAAGNHSVSAEIAAVTTPDPDSRPSNGAAGEDDLDALTIVGGSLVGPPGPQGPPGLAVAFADTRFKGRRGSALRLRYAATSAARVVLVARRRRKVVKRVSGVARRGANTLTVRGLPAGTFTLSLRATAGTLRASDRATAVVSR